MTMPWYFWIPVVSLFVLIAGIPLWGELLKRGDGSRARLKAQERKGDVTYDLHKDNSP